jgi:hypothetical protein
MSQVSPTQLKQHIQAIAAQYQPQLLELTELAFQSSNVQQIRARRDLVLHQMRLEQFEPLRVKNPVHLAWFTIDELPKALTGRILHAIEFVRLLVRQPLEHPDFYLEVIDRPEMVCEFRFVKTEFSEVYFRRDAPTRVILHELGHWLEESVAATKRAALAHLEPRVQNEAPRQLGVGYHPLEYTQPDAFINAYVGKCQADGSRVYTELVSTGLEYLYENPLQLFEQDPQTAAFLLDLLEFV